MQNGCRFNLLMCVIAQDFNVICFNIICVQETNMFRETKQIIFNSNGKMNTVSS